MVEQLQKPPDNNALREKIAKFAAAMRPQPAVPEAAREHLVNAEALQKEATTPADYELPIEEYHKALLLAPWWSDAYYDLASALELTQHYAEAIEDLKLSVLADPHGPGARAAQDKLYTVEAEKEKSDREKTAPRAAAVQPAQSPTTLMCDSSEDGNLNPTRYFDIDEGAGTVTPRWPKWYIPNSSYSEPAGSENYKATFGPKSVTFVSIQGAGTQVHYKAYAIDRLTSIVEIKDSVYAPYEQASDRFRSLSHWNCHVVTAEF